MSLGSNRSLGPQTPQTERTITRLTHSPFSTDSSHLLNSTPNIDSYTYLQQTDPNSQFPLRFNHSNQSTFSIPPFSAPTDLAVPCTDQLDFYVLTDNPQLNVLFSSDSPTLQSNARMQHHFLLSSNSQ
jgi:hypothetical protein